MFRLITRLMLLMLLLWCCLLAGAVLGGQQQADTDSLAQYGFSACELPCWSGIMPGETTAGFIIPLLERNIPAYISARFPEWGVVTFRLKGDIGGNVRFDETVNQIYLLNLEIAAGYLLNHLSVPDCVNVDDAAMLLIWNRGTNVIVAGFQDSPKHILSGAKIDSTGLMIFEGGADFCQNYPAWHGFAPLWFYRQKSERQ